MQDAILNSKLNWLRDDGINLHMINDVVRNSFYNQILTDSVKNKNCCDIGFGTGLLTLLALKHGAASVVAYEKDQHRYELGQHIISRLKLSNKVKLFHLQATSEHIFDQQFDVVFQEIIHQNIWGEGLWSIRPSTSNTNFIPGKFFLEICANEISDVALDGLINSGGSLDYFNPGIDMPADFVNIVNEVILGPDIKKIETKYYHNDLVRLNRAKMQKYWSWNPAQVFSRYNKVIVGKYEVDFNQCNITKYDSAGIQTLNLEQDDISLAIHTEHWQDKKILLECKFGIQHNQEKLYLDNCQGWGQSTPWMLLHPTKNLQFTQNFCNGWFKFNLQ